MSTHSSRLEEIRNHRSNVSLQINTLGTFDAIQQERHISGQSWGREKSIQLLQFLITHRARKGLRKEQIIDRLWEDVDGDEGDRDFKVALHGIHKVLEPNRPPRTDPKYISRQGTTYQLNLHEIWIDAQAMEDLISLGNEALSSNKLIAIEAFREAVKLHHGVYLPNRIYEDWTSVERERINVLILGAYLALAELVLEDNPMESIQLTQKAISLDKTWEDAYLLQMKAYIQKGNRPAAMKTYHQCIRVLDEEFGLDPLPETQELYDSIVHG